MVWKRQTAEHKAISERILHKTERLASSHWLYGFDILPIAFLRLSLTVRQKHVSTGEEAILVAVGDQLF